VSVSGPAASFTPDAIDSFATMVQEAARSLEEALGELPADHVRMQGTHLTDLLR
jgi:hypothetical protein